MTVAALSRAPVAPAPETSGNPGPPGPQVAMLLARGVVDVRMTFPEGGGARLVHGWEPPQLSDQEAAAARDRLQAVEAALAPAPRAELLSRVLALLSHFRGDPHPPEVEEMIADDWAEDLGGYPMWAVEAAARHWRRNRRFRPQISEMVALCDSAIAGLSEEAVRLRSIWDRFHQEASPRARQAYSVVSDLASKLGGTGFREKGEGFRGGGRRPTW